MLAPQPIGIKSEPGRDRWLMVVQEQVAGRRQAVEDRARPASVFRLTTMLRLLRLTDAK